MINLAFITVNRKLIKFKINNKVVEYIDDVWTDGIQIMPKDPKIILKLKTSRKPNLQMMAALILDANKGADFQEYKKCTTDEEVAEVIRKDCKSKGLMEVK